MSSNLPGALGTRRQLASLSFGYDFFISYSRAQRTYAEDLWTKLEAAGLVVAIDRADLNPGAPLAEVLRLRIKRSAHLVLLDSPQARLSPYVLDEVRTAVEFERNRCRIRLLRAFRDDDDQEAAGAPPPDPFAYAFANDIWIDDTADPSTEGPALRTIEELLKLHRTTRVKRRLFATLASFLLIATLSLATFWTSSTAHRRAADAAAGYESADVSMASADAGAHALFDSWLFPLFNLFADQEEWQVKDAALNAFLKPRPPMGRPTSPVPAACEATGLPAGQVCAAISRDGAVRAIGHLIDANRCWNVSISRDGGPWTAARRREDTPVSRVALSATLVALVSDTSLSVYRWQEDQTFPRAELDIGGRILDLRFSPDEERLIVVWMDRPALSDRTMVAIVDVETLTVLGVRPLLMAFTTTDQNACQDRRASIAFDPRGRAFTVSDGVSTEHFDIGDRQFTRLGLPVPMQSSSVIGAAQGPGGTVLLWTNSGAVALCTQSHDAARSGTVPCVQLVSRSDGGLLGGPGAEAGTIASEREMYLRDTEQRCWRLTLTSDRWLANKLEDPPSSGLPSDAGLAPTPGCPARASTGSGRTLAIAAPGDRLTVAPDGSIEWSRFPGRPFFGEVSRWGTVTAGTIADGSQFMFIGTEGVGESALHIGRPRWRDAGARWRVLRTVGSALSLQVADDGAHVVVVERWNRHAVVRRYPLSARATAQLLRPDPPDLRKATGR